MPYVLNVFLKVIWYVCATCWRKYRQFVFTSCWTRSTAFILKLLSISSKQEYLTASRASKLVEISDSLYSTNYSSITRNSSKPFYLNSLCLRTSAISWCFHKKIPWTVLSLFLLLFHQKKKSLANYDHLFNQFSSSPVNVAFNLLKLCGPMVKVISIFHLIDVHLLLFIQIAFTGSHTHSSRHCPHSILLCYSRGWIYKDLLTSCTSEDGTVWSPKHSWASIFHYASLTNAENLITFSIFIHFYPAFTIFL